VDVTGCDQVHSKSCVQLLLLPPPPHTVSHGAKRSDHHPNQGQAMLELSASAKVDPAVGNAMPIGLMHCHVYTFMLLMCSQGSSLHTVVST
jgi:hypothetical protein